MLTPRDIHNKGTIKAQCIWIQVFLSVFAVTAIDTAPSQTIPPPQPQTNDMFGQSVSIHENVALVGAHHDNTKGQFVGAAYVFEKLNGKWTQKDKLFADDTQVISFGFSVSIYKQYALVSSLSHAVYAFEVIAGKWTQTDKLISPTSTAFGEKVSIYNEYALISSSSQPYAYIFERGTDRKWQKKQKLIPDGAYPDLEFVNSVSLHGEQAVIGTSESGAYIFEKVDSIWTQTVALKRQERSFGSSVSIYSDCALIGSRYGGATHDGAAYIYRKLNGKWEQTLPKLVGVDVESNFGNKVVLTDEMALIGSARYVFVFKNDKETNTWKLTKRLSVASDISIYKYDVMIGRVNAPLEYYDESPPKPPLPLQCWDSKTGEYKDAPITFTAHFPSSCDGGSLRIDTRRDPFVKITEINFGGIATSNSVSGLYDSMRSGDTTLTIAADKGTDGLFYTQMQCYDNKGAKCYPSEMTSTKDAHSVAAWISKYYNFILVNVMVSVLITLCMLCMVYYCYFGDKTIKYKRVIQEDV